MENPSLRRRIALVRATFLAFLLLIGILTGLHYCGLYSMRSSPVVPQNIIISSNNTLSAPHRKLLRREAEAEAGGVVPNRVWGDTCSKADIVINQGPTAPLPSGIPTYTVEIMNVCVTGCDIAGIHLSCGWFSSARLINPRIFKRLRYDDCLVNNGKPLANGRTLSFQYANTFRYPLSVSRVIC